MKYEDSFISNTFIMGDINANLSYSADLRPQKKGSDYQNTVQIS